MISQIGETMTVNSLPCPDEPELNLLPVLIDGPGDYLTRDGRRVTIHTVREHRPGVTFFAAAGGLWREFRGTIRPKGYRLWHRCGRGSVFGEAGSDIVCKAA